MNKTITLNNGALMPSLGFGTWQAAPGQVEKATEVALASGYTHIDAAKIYGNEAEIGTVLHKVFSQGSIKREDLFITTKLWSTDWGRVEEACNESLKNLQLDYIDLYLVHSPIAYVYKPGINFPRESEGKGCTLDWIPVHVMWQNMEKLVHSGKVKSIGISNWPVLMVRDLLSFAKIKPAVNQIEVHPYFQQHGLANFCNDYGIHVSAYSPLANGKEGPLSDPLVKQIASKHSVSPAQVLIRYCIDKGYSVLPKSVTPERIKENAQVFHFKLTQEEVKSLDGLQKNFRTCDLAFFSGHPFYD